jgi:hypothetical protein
MFDTACHSPVSVFQCLRQARRTFWFFQSPKGALKQWRVPDPGQRAAQQQPMGTDDPGPEPTSDTTEDT